MINTENYLTPTLHYCILAGPTLGANKSIRYNESETLGF